MVCPSISWSDSTLGNITCYFTRREELGGGLVRHRDGQLAVRVPRHGFGSSGNIGPIWVLPSQCCEAYVLPRPFPLLKQSSTAKGTKNRLQFAVTHNSQADDNLSFSE
ncbi:hypothetical protein ACQJBY_043070 [Aegilops geniculata]